MEMSGTIEQLLTLGKSPHLLRIYRFDEVGVEPGFPCVGSVSGRTVTSKGYQEDLVTATS
jgi:hypothetical protein